MKASETALNDVRSAFQSLGALPPGHASEWLRNSISQLLSGISTGDAMLTLRLIDDSVTAAYDVRGPLGALISRLGALRDAINEERREESQAQAAREAARPQLTKRSAA